MAKGPTGIEGLDIERAEKSMGLAVQRADHYPAGPAEEHLGGITALSEAIDLEVIPDLKAQRPLGVGHIGRGMLPAKITVAGARIV
jgi:hypothetical protein